MPEATSLQTNFTAGEVSTRLTGRVDVSKYRNGVERLYNFLSQKHGGTTRRPGTRHVAAAKDATTPVRVIPFQFNVDQTYILEFGNQYVRFYRDEGQLEWLGVPTEIVSPYTPEQLAAIKFVQSNDVLFLCHPDVRPRRLRRLAGDDADPATWSIVDAAIYDGPYLDENSGGGTITPSAVAGTDVTLTATNPIFSAGDAVGPTGNGNAYGRHVRLRHGNQWGWASVHTYTSPTVVRGYVHYPFGSTNPADDYRLSAFNDDDGWPWVPQIHRGRLIYGGYNGNPQFIGFSKIGNFNSFSPSANEDGAVLAENGLALTIDDDGVNAIRVLASDEKGVLVGTDGGEYVITAGAIGDIITPLDVQARRQTSYGVNATVRGHQVGEVLLLLERSGRKLREMVYRFDADRFLAPDLTILSEHITGNGVVDAAYQQEPDSILWMAREDGELLGFTYEREQDVLAWHRHRIGGRLQGLVGGAAVKSVAVIREGTDDQLWLVVQRTANGVTAQTVEFMENQFPTAGDPEDAFFVDCGLTLDTRQNIGVGGSITSALPPVVTVPAGHGYSTGDRVRVRQAFNTETDTLDHPVNGVSFLVNVIDATRFELHDLEDVPVDGSGWDAIKLGSGTVAKESTVIGGLTHLEGESVDVLANGAPQGPFTVSSGQITLDDPASIVHAGAPVPTPEILTLPIVPQADVLNASGVFRNNWLVLLRFIDTIGAELGFDGGEIDPIIFREVADDVANAPPLFSGIKEQRVQMSHAREGRVLVRQTKPVPMTLLSITTKIDVGGS